MEQNKVFDKIREIWTKIKGIKHIKIIIGILAVAIMILAYSGITSKTKSNKTSTDIQKETTETSTVTYSEEEEKLADILEKIDGIGKTKVFIRYKEKEEINGVIIVAEGAENSLVEWKIRHAVQTVLKIDYQSIDVYSMK